MNRSIFLFSTVFLFAASFSISAQDGNIAFGNTMGGVRRRAVVMNIDARVLNEEQEVIWNENHRRLAIPGSPVGIQLVGANVVVAIQFTPFLHRSGNVLVVQGQIWSEDPGRGVSYYTSIQTIPLELGEPIIFYPLGQGDEIDASIEVVITILPYNSNEAEDISTTEND